MTKVRREEGGQPLQPRDRVIREGKKAVQVHSTGRLLPESVSKYLNFMWPPFGKESKDV